MALSPPREHPLWLKIPLNASGPLGLGLALLGYLNIFLGVSFTLIGLLYAGWEIHPYVHRFVQRRPAVSLPVFLGVFLLLGFCSWLAYLKIKPAPVASNPDPVVQVSWKVASLPITLAPQTSADILLVRQDKILDLQNFLNNQDKSWQWPIKGRIWPPELANILKFENQGKVGLFNVVIPISADFQVGDNPPKTVASAQTTYRIESLPPGQSVQLYIVNLSDYTIDTPMPTTATLTIEGSRDRRDVTLTHFGMLAEIGAGFPTESLVLPLNPTAHRWVGTKPEPKEK